MSPERAARIEKWGALALALAIGLASAAHVLYYFPRVVDDLFISLRYAENLARGRGFVYNLGERVEGFSSPLWAVLQAVGLLFRIEGVLWTKLLGVASFAAMHVGVHRFTREIASVRSPIVALLPNVFLALNSYVVLWVVMGLETPLHLALIPWTFVALRRATAEGATPQQVRVAVAVAIGMATVRPEGPMWVAVAFATEALSTPRFARTEIVAHVRRMARVGLPVFGVALALLLARRAYYGLWLPHTYYVKGADAGFDTVKLAFLRGKGAPRSETWLLLSGLLLLAVSALRRSRAAGVVVGVVALYFTAKVELDWMPSMRHTLPLYLVAPVGIAWACDALLSRFGARPLPLLATAFGFAATITAGVAIAELDARSQGDKYGTGLYTRPKTKEALQETLLALRRVVPPHVKAMHPFHMGMVTQNYRILEASNAPLSSTWFAGRDIGKVGYYVDVRVFETAGLFTPDCVADPTWRAKRHPSQALIDKMMARKPIALQLYDGWGFFLARNPARLEGYQILSGGPEHPIDLDAKIDGPDPEEILRRYESSLAKFPKTFYLATLYGESVGAAMERRTGIVRAIVEDVRAMPADPPPEAAPAGLPLDDGALLSRGCTVSPQPLVAGKEGVVRCWIDVLKANRKPWTFFVHFVDSTGTPHFYGDHAPVSGLSPSWKWRDGQKLRDVARFVVPPLVPPGKYSLRWGLFWGGRRASVGSAPVIDDTGRLIGPTIEVVR